MGRTVLITGASGGIGISIAERFLSDGWNAALNCFSNSEPLETLRRLYPESCEVFPADITVSSDVDAMVGHICERFGGIDCLVNNSGISLVSLITDTTDEEWNRVFSVNSTGTFFCCRAVLPRMIHRQSGTIINISSMWGQIGASCEAAYSASKAAVIGFSKALAKEVGPSGIRVNCVCPGLIDTKMNAHLSSEDISSLTAETPVGRIGKPEDIASLVHYLASEESSFITGQIIGSNGGLVI